MEDAGLILIDKLIQLVELRHYRRRNHFGEFIEPMYKDAEQIAHDYIALIHEVIDRLAKRDRITDIMSWLEQRRVRHLPLRIKVRAFLHRASHESIFQNLDKFERGVWGLLTGSISICEDGRVWYSAYDHGSHTVLDLMYHLAGTISLEDKVPEHEYQRCLEFAQRQDYAIQKAWNDVSEAYLEMKQQATK